MLSDADCIHLGRARPTAFEAVILAVLILLTAVAMAVCAAIGIEWLRGSNSKDAKTSKPALASEWSRKPETTGSTLASLPIPPAFWRSPFARQNGALYLPDPVSSEALRESLLVGFAPVQQALTDLQVRTPEPAIAASDEPAISAALPPARAPDHEEAQARNSAVASANIAAVPKAQASPSPPAAASSPTFWERLFHIWRANKDIKLPPEAGARTAVYDIKRHLVYLPNGEKLEAHSGRGRGFDNARYVKARGRGPTPPNVYHLALRESLFHGVRAIRLNPVSDAAMHGRDGMLAHPYMLGPEGESNGCVSLANYPKFLRAFLRGDIDRLIVVPRFDGADSLAAAVVQTDKQYASQ